ncbi:MAG: RagB/SusD family nutrient uptake outer membrane protein [Bacteroidales bacterium]|nr:RagB/SusD family nutrient uptake outer membrane protein [Bacteroidales bacterium]MDE7072117.1 RagB/SusD family nutrient uptake outer membrane protein [Bacteroidales bacterium]
MKRIQYIGAIACAAIILLFSSCSNDYLNRTPTSALDTEVVMSNPDYVSSTVVGTMRLMYSYGFGGRNATLIGDMMTDMVSSIRGSNGTMLDMERWNIQVRTTEVSSFWANGYAIAAASARTISAAERLLNSSSTTNTQATQLRSAIAASLVTKVYAEYFLTQYFCVDYNLKENSELNNGVPYQMPGSNPYTVGIVVLKGAALGLEEAANMSTLEDTYAYMEAEIDSAISYFNQSGSKNFILSPTRYYPTLCAAYVLKARLALAQHKYDQAIEAAQNALENLPSGANATLISNADNLLGAYGTTPSSEDIWLLNYTSADNLSANSLQNMFDSYGCNPSNYALSLFKTGDIRRALYIGKDEAKPSQVSTCKKYPEANAVFNVPVLRVPEIYLIQAEAKAASGDVEGAKEALLAVLGARDTSVQGDMSAMESKYAITESTIRQVIMDENAREFLCEGHRWSDLRRNGMRLSRPGDKDNEQYQLHFTNYPLATFAFPVPYDETTTEQWKKGKGIIDAASNAKDSKNWNNNAWDKLSGDIYGAGVTLPAEGTDYADYAN